MSKFVDSMYMRFHVLQQARRLDTLVFKALEESLQAYLAIMITHLIDLAERSEATPDAKEFAYIYLRNLKA
jgi:hypothetical protein